VATLKKILIALLALALLGGGGYIAFGRGQTVDPAPVAAAAPVQASDQVVAEAKVVPARSAALSLSTGGVVAAVLAQEGDLVTAGQVIARLDDAEQRATVASAETKLQQARASLEKLLAGATPEEIAASEAQLRAAEAQLRQTQGSVTQEDVRASQAQLAQAQAQLARLKSGPKDVDVRSAQAALDQAHINLQAQRDQLSANKTNAQLQLAQASDALIQAQTRYSTAKWHWQHVQDNGTDPLNPKMTAPDGQTVKNKLNSAQKQQYHDAFVQAEVALHSAEQAVTQAQVAYDTARQAEINGLAAAEQQVVASQAGLERLHIPADADQVASANAQLAGAQAELARLKGDQRSGALDAAQAQVDAAQANLAHLKAGAPESELALARAQLASAEAELNLARLRLAELELKAPFAGTIAALDLRAGEYVTPGATVVRLADISAWQIETSDLTELSIAKVRAGAPVTMTFDALPGVELAGEVARIKEYGESKQGDITYTVVIAPERQEAQLRWNMTAAVKITPAK
jgi:HlyD family secretion protein